MPFITMPPNPITKAGTKARQPDGQSGEREGNRPGGRRPQRSPFWCWTMPWIISTSPKAAPWLAKKLSEHYGCRVVFQPLDQLVRELELYRDQLPVKEGELAETSHLAVGTNILLTYILSSRYDIKKANDQTQTLWGKMGGAFGRHTQHYRPPDPSRFPPHRLSGADAQPRPRFPLRLFGGRSSPGYALPVPAGFRHCGGDHR